MTRKPNHKLIDAESQATIQELLQEQLRLAIKLTMIRVMEEAVEAFVNAAPDQRTAERRDYRNGTSSRNVGTAMGVSEALPVPPPRKGLRSQLCERYQRRQGELANSICEMFLQGLSTKQVGDLVEPLSGNHPSPSTVSRIVHTLEEALTTWNKRLLPAHDLDAIADGTYFSVMYDGQGQKCRC